MSFSDCIKQRNAHFVMLHTPELCMDNEREVAYHIVLSNWQNIYLLPVS
jgi:hypothetical protein